MKIFWTFSIYVRFEVFTAVTMKNAVFWDVAPSRSYVNQRFGGMYRFHLQGRKTRKAGTSVSRWLQSAVWSHLITLVSRSRIFLPWRWRRFVPPKCRFTQDLYSATSQKTKFFIFDLLYIDRNTSKMRLSLHIKWQCMLSNFIWR
jgi:hypothetical protein